MTKKEIAEKLRSMATIDHSLPSALNEIADELDPPKPELGAVVWWKYDEFEKWELGIAGENGIAIEGGGEVGWEEHGLQWKPARILGPRQAAVDVPPVSKWPEGTRTVHIWVQYTDNLRGEILKTITRAEAERMEAEDADT